MKRIFIALTLFVFMASHAGYAAHAAPQKNATSKKIQVKKDISAKKATALPKKPKVKKGASIKKSNSAKKATASVKVQKQAQKSTTMTVVKTISAAASNLPIPETYHITSPTSATFSVGETLRGEPFTAVGTTSEVSGSIVLDRLTPSKTTLTPINVNAKTFKTESSGRDFMIKKFILKAEDAGNEFIVFNPKTVTGLPASFESGKSIPLTLSGDLTIAGVTRAALFTGSVTVSNDSIQGSASTKIQRADYGIVVPSVPFVASVDDEVTLSISLSAKQ